MPLMRHIRRRRDERGAAMVEFAFVMGLLFVLLLTGIIDFGLILAFKQNMTQSASEAARASIAVVDDPGTDSVDERKDVALSSMEAAMTEFDRACGSTAFCLVAVHQCNTDFDFGAIKGQDRATLVKPPAAEPADACLSTHIEFENSGDGRILPPFPIISAFEPDTLSSQTTVHLVPVPDLP